MRYFRYENGYVGVTEECPRGLKGLVFVGRGPRPGGGVESVYEQAYAINQLEKMERVAADEVPDDWFAAIGLEQRPSNVMEVTIELPGDRLRRMILAKPGTKEHARWREDRALYAFAAILSFALWWWIVFVWQYQ